MLPALFLMFATPIQPITEDAIVLWKYCVMEKARIYEPTKETVSKVADLAINSCEDLEKEFLKAAIAEFSAIPVRQSSGPSSKPRSHVINLKIGRAVKLKY